MVKPSPRIPNPSSRRGPFTTNCHPDRSGPIFSFAPFSGASGRAVEGSLRCFSLLCSTLCVLCVLTSVNSVLPSLFLAFLFRAAFWRVGPRSAVCAPRALRRGGGICFSFLPFSSLLFSFLLFSSLFFSSLCARRLPRPGRGDLCVSLSLLWRDCSFDFQLKT